MEAEGTFSLEVTLRCPSRLPGPQKRKLAACTTSSHCLQGLKASFLRGGSREGKHSHILGSKFRGARPESPSNDCNNPFLNQWYFIVSYKYFPRVPYLQLQNSL